MIINWYGEGCFKLQVDGITIVIDPFESSTGLTPPRGQADIVIKTLLPAPQPITEPATAKEQTNQIISGPGEYEVKGVSITGWPLLKDSSPAFIKTVYHLKTEDLELGILGHLTEFNEPEILEELGHVDILFIPGGGKPFIDQEAAAKLIRQINPRLVIPSFFKVPGLKRKAEDSAEFLKEMGQKVEAEEKLSVRGKELTQEKTKVVLLKV